MSVSFDSATCLFVRFGENHFTSSHLFCYLYNEVEKKIFFLASYSPSLL